MVIRASALKIESIMNQITISPIPATSECTSSDNPNAKPAIASLTKLEVALTPEI